MSIVPLVKVTVYGHQSDKKMALAGMQELGCLHIIPMQSAGNVPHDDSSSVRIREALKFLKSCTRQLPDEQGSGDFDTLSAVADEVLDLQLQSQQLSDERETLVRRIKDLQPWGDFIFPPDEDRHLLRFWFYVVPHSQMVQIEESNLCWEAVGSDDRSVYVVVISESEPQEMPVARTQTGNVPLSELKNRLNEVERTLEDCENARAGLTRWCGWLARILARLEDQATLSETLKKTYDDLPLFVLQAWAPRDSVEPLKSHASNGSLVLEIEEALPEETPPTLLRNRPALASGQDLVSFYMTPNYWYSDPSVIVLFSFVLFFGMIVGDVGYGLLLGLVVLMSWKRMDQSIVGRRFRILFVALVGITVIWGAMVGSYFGVAPEPGTLMGGFKLLDLNDYGKMMQISIIIGAAHVILANMVEIRRLGFGFGMLSPAGWVAMVVGGLVLGYGGGPAGYWLLGAGGAGVLFFTGVSGTPGQRLIKGLLGLTRVTNCFGDVLSYLRLFALGLATSSLAVTFNDLAMQVLSAMPGIGLLFAMFILLIGHGLNFALALVSGFVHGLRLNFIEFFNWSAPEEGVPFRAFAKKETATWSP